MTPEEDYEAALTRAATYARAWLDSVPDRLVPPRRSADELTATFGGSLPDQGAPLPRSSTSWLPGLSRV